MVFMELQNTKRLKILEGKWDWDFCDIIVTKMDREILRMDLGFDAI